MFICQTVSTPNNLGHWEEVNEYIFHNCEKVVLPDGSPRYNGNCAALHGGGRITLVGTFNANELAQVLRIFNMENLRAETMPGGFLRQVEFVRLNIKGKSLIHDIDGGKTYKAA